MAHVHLAMPKPKISGTGHYTAPAMEREEFQKLRAAANALHQSGQHDLYFPLARALDEIARLRPDIEP